MRKRRACGTFFRRRDIRRPSVYRRTLNADARTGGPLTIQAREKERRLYLRGLAAQDPKAVFCQRFRRNRASRIAGRARAG